MSYMLAIIAAWSKSFFEYQTAKAVEGTSPRFRKVNAKSATAILARATTQYKDDTKYLPSHPPTHMLFF